MCTPIYYIHNVTLWSCPEKILCPLPVTINQTENEHANISTNVSNTSTVPSINQTLHNRTIVVNQTVTSNTTPSPTTPSTTTPSSTTPSPTTPTATTPSTTTPSSTTPTDTTPTDTTPSTTNLRHNSSNNTGGLPIECYCAQNLDYLHVFWAIPTMALLLCYIWFRRRTHYKIQNLFTAYRSRTLRRSRSWPEMIQKKSPINNRAQSEPAFDSIVI